MNLNYAIMTTAFFFYLLACSERRLQNAPPQTEKLTDVPPELLVAWLEADIIKKRRSCTEALHEALGRAEPDDKAIRQERGCEELILSLTDSLDDLQPSAEAAAYLSSLGGLAFELALPREAERAYRREVEIREQLGRQNHALAVSLKNLGCTQRDAGKYWDSEQTLVRSLQVYEAIGELGTQSAEGARNCLAKATSLDEQLSFARGIFLLGRPRAAVEYLDGIWARLALDAPELLMRRDISDALDFIDSLRATGDMYLQAAEELESNPIRSFEIAILQKGLLQEAWRLHHLVGTIGGGGEPDRSYVAATRTFSESSRAVAPGLGQEETRRAAIDRINSDASQWAEAHHTWFRRYTTPLDASAWFAPRTVDILAALGKRGSGLLEIVRHDRYLFPTDSMLALPCRETVYDAWFLDGRTGTVQAWTIGNAKEVDELVKAVWSSRTADLTAAEALGQRVLGNAVGAWISGCDVLEECVLHYAPDGLLASVPLEAMVVPGQDSRRALEVLGPVRYVDSGRMLLEPASTGKGSGMLLVRAGPEEPRTHTGPDSTLWVGDRRSVEGAKVDPLDLISQMAAHDVVHFDGHARVDPFPDLKGQVGWWPWISQLIGSGLQLDVGPDGSPIVLTALEVSAADLSRVRLMVLASCAAARGAETDGQGLIGLRWAFGVAGVRSTVAPLWAIDASATADLLQPFYAEIAAGTDPAVALWRARRTLWEFSTQPDTRATPAGQYAARAAMGFILFGPGNPTDGLQSPVIRQGPVSISGAAYPGAIDPSTMDFVGDLISLEKLPVSWRANAVPTSTGRLYEHEELSIGGESAKFHSESDRDALIDSLQQCGKVDYAWSDRSKGIVRFRRRYCSPWSLLDTCD